MLQGLSTIIQIPIEQILDKNYMLSLGQDNKKIIFTEISTNIFNHIRSLSGISKAEFIHSLDSILNKNSLLQIKEGEGKSGSFFFDTHNKRLMIKILQNEEKKVIENFLENYEKHLKNNSESYLLRIYSLFELKVPGLAKTYAILIPNAFFIQGTLYVRLYE